RCRELGRLLHNIKENHKGQVRRSHNPVILPSTGRSFISSTISNLFDIGDIKKLDNKITIIFERVIFWQKKIKYITFTFYRQLLVENLFELLCLFLNLVKKAARRHSREKGKSKGKVVIVSSYYSRIKLDRQCEEALISLNRQSNNAIHL
ncbi:4684_t:CDS:2, partial [Cetraspora pellucida]